MTIERFGPFGEALPLPSGAPTVTSDRALRALVLRHRSEGTPIPPVGLLGGDLSRTLGGTGSADRLTSTEATTFAVDVGRLELDGATTWFVAHVLIGRLFRGGIVVMQAEWLGDLDLGPRSHPSDGRFDVTSGALPLGERRRARVRARTGSHLPHPALEHRQQSHLEIDLRRPTPVVADGVALGRFRRVRVVLEPEALTVVV